MNKLGSVVLSTGLLLSGVAGVGVDAPLAASKSEVTTVQKTSVKKVKYMGVDVVADTALEQVLATNFLKGSETINLTSYKEIKDYNYLVDRIQKVTYQNPLILGVSGYTYEYSKSTKKLHVTYLDKQSTMITQQKKIIAKAKSILPKIVTSKMTENQKHKAIYDYLTANAKYDFEAAKYAGSSMLTVNSKYKNDYTTYGVMIEKNGVCQSYANSYQLLSTMAGLQSIVVTGELNGGPHAWNKIKLGSTWVNVDVTNNFTNTHIPYDLYESNDTQARSQGYKEDKMFWTDKDISKFASKGKLNDYYVQNKLEVKDLAEYKERLEKAIKNKSSKDKYITFRTAKKINEADIMDVARDIIYGQGYHGFSFYYSGNYSTLVLPLVD